MTEPEYRPPSDLRQMFTVTRYELFKYVRSYRLLGIFSLAALIIGLIMVLPPLLGQAYPKDPAFFAQRFYLWVNVLVVVGATLFAGDSLASEFQNRTGFLMFPNPVKRWVYFSGKVLASVSTLFVVILVYYLVVSSLTIWHSGTISDLTYSSLGLALLYSVAALGVGYLISSAMKGSTGALVLTFAVLFLILPILDGVLSFAQAKPVFSLTFSAQAISFIMQTPYPSDMLITTPVGGRFGGSSGGDTVTFYNYYPDVSTAVLVMIIYAVVSITIALLIFRRRDMVA